MRRRDFIKVIAGSAFTWSASAWAQQAARIPRIAILWIIAENDPQLIKNRGTFLKQLHQLGWRAGENVHIDQRWSATDANRQRAHATELIGLAPDLIVAEGTPGLAAAQLATRTIPIIFVNVNRDSNCDSEKRSAFTPQNSFATHSGVIDGVIRRQLVDS